MKRLWLWQKAGYQMEPDELDFEQMQALAQIARYYEVKDHEALIKSISPAG